MPALPIDFDPYNPIPNNPFYSLPTNYLQGPFGPLVIGSGLSVSTQGVISSTGGGGGGTVTAITAGLGLTGGTITGTGTIGLAPSGVTAGAYTYPALSVDASGRITSIMSGSPVTGITASIPLQLTGSATSPTISIQPASTSQTGSVQLNNTTTSTLTNQALTAAAGKSLQDQINAVAQNANGLVLAGTLNAATGNVANATTAGVSAGFTAGSPVPAASPAINDYYVIVTTAAASYTPTGGAAITGVNVGDYILCSSGAWTILRVGPITGAYATTTTAGVVELATSAEAITGTDPNLVLTPFTGAATYVARKCFTGPGQILASNGNATYAALGSGIDGQVLTADSSAPLGVKWAAGGGGGGGASINMSFLAPITGTTNPYSGGVVAVGINTASTTALGAVQLATTANTQAGVATNLAVTPAGAAASYLPLTAFTAKGQIIVGTGTGTYGVENVGTDGLALVACAACANGVTYANPLAAATPSTLGAFKGYAAGVGGNLSLGGSALAAIGAGVANTALGTQAATTLTTGNGNTVVGNGALALDTTGSCNVAMGVCALYSTVGGEGNTALGTGAGATMTSGDFNVLVGFCAGDVVTTGCYNVAIGANAMGTTSTTGCNNVLIGCTAGGNVTSQSNQIVIGGGNSCTTGTANGGVTFVFGGGCALYASANGTNTWTAVSDARLKDNVADLALGLEFVGKLQPRSFNWKADGAPAAGFIAQEVAEVVDEHDADYLHLVDRSNEHLGLSATTLIPVLVNAIKELKAEVDELKAKLG